MKTYLGEELYKVAEADLAKTVKFGDKIKKISGTAAAAAKKVLKSPVTHATAGAAVGAGAVLASKHEKVKKYIDDNPKIKSALSHPATHAVVGAAVGAAVVQALRSLKPSKTASAGAFSEYTGTHPGGKIRGAAEYAGDKLKDVKDVVKNKALEAWGEGSYADNWKKRTAILAAGGTAVLGAGIAAAKKYKKSKNEGAEKETEKEAEFTSADIQIIGDFYVEKAASVYEAEGIQATAEDITDLALNMYNTDLDTAPEKVASLYMKLAEDAYQANEVNEYDESDVLKLAEYMAEIPEEVSANIIEKLAEVEDAVKTAGYETPSLDILLTIAADVVE